jgi:hypothetical protein
MSQNMNKIPCPGSQYPSRPSSVAIQAALATEAAMSQEPDCGRRRQFHEGSQRSPHGTVRYSLSMQSFQAPSEARCKRPTAMQRN